ncbi:hypothetical protein PGT21_009028 [Puccinia graminis f. sp. tritici]|uniref:HD/PDEase domain-containing protein n=2 Tax=Puccinia graminis f. sp. tritici TaxID=56615 RepID=E3JXN7_PUCGT|nr:uncharacterized protein PGTG_02273 [Puccinia graminis f. sp. tritici CRL 75-36-700-3]EFP76812.2 hypothetical protein PGTG_02273 [Puccinia graminis f. sp. tritici CRL 75-36-700-3]KAA1118872.1 hypothetical protein PGT21_009028 [Puccinia graminis f. sp. tritici]
MASVSTCQNLGFDFNLREIGTINHTPLENDDNLTSTTGDEGSAKNANPSACIEIDDLIYGKVLIESPCAVEIINLPEFQRLKDVLQHGITALIGLLPSPPVNRFDHSVGAMILVKHVGGSEEAQLAALLHDVSHTALSHVTDSVFGYVVHEVEKGDFLDKTQIPNVLQKHGFDPERVFEEKLFPLLELPSPEICADRLDYALRDSVSFGYLALKDAQEIYRSTISIDGKMVLSSTEAAKQLAEAYLMSDQKVWADGAQSYLYKLAADAIRLSLKEGTITKEALWTCGDQAFWDLLVENASAQVKKIVEQVNCRCTLIETNEQVAPVGGSEEHSGQPTSASEEEAPPAERCTLKIRVRTIDPPVKTAEGIQPLSALDPSFGHRRLDYIRSRQTPVTFIVKYSPLVG